MAGDVDGLDAILKRINVMATTGKMAVGRAMVRAGLNAAGKQMKADLDPKAKLGKTAVKGRFKKGKTKIAALVGFGVGPRPKKEQSMPARAKGRGVGIVRNNVHWWLAGPKQRSTGSVRGKPTGNPIQSRGIMPAMQPGLARIAFAKATGKIKTEMIKRGALQLIKQTEKLQKVK